MDEEIIAELMDLADLTEGQAAGIAEWHAEQLAEQRADWGGMVLVRLLTWLLDGHSAADMRLRVTATAFGLGLGHLTHHKSQEAAAKALSVSAMAVSDMAKRAKEAITPRQGVS
jgi:hypothetical protein